MATFLWFVIPSMPLDIALLGFVELLQLLSPPTSQEFPSLLDVPQHFF